MQSIIDALANFPLRKTALVVLIAMLALTWLVGLFGAEPVLTRIDYLIGFPIEGTMP